MIPGKSHFSHLPCVFGKDCKRPHCLYSHPEIEENVLMPSTSTSVQIEQADEENYYQKYEYKAYYQSASSNPFPTYDDPIYQPYIPTEYSYEQESVDQYEPVIPEYVPKPITKAPQPAITTKRKHHTYSVLDDKPSIPADLGNDEILLGLSEAHKQTAPVISKPKPVQTKTQQRPTALKVVAKPLKVNSAEKAQPSKLARPPNFDAEKELREIEILERKTRLLKEYKELTQQIAEIESKRKTYADPKFVKSLFEDEEDMRHDEDESIVQPPKKITRIAHPTIPKRVEPVRKISYSGPSTRVEIRRPPIAVVAPTKNEPKTAIQSGVRSAGMAKTSYQTQMIKRYETMETKPVASSSKSDLSRVAHVVQAPQLTPIDRFSTKIPFNQRHRSLQKLYDEFCKHPEISSSQAVEMSQNEEKLLFDRSQTTTGYASALAGAVRGIRNKQFVIPSVNSEGKIIRSTSITEIMEKERKTAARQFSEEQFYQILSNKYLLTPEQLKENGYPYVFKDEQGRKSVKIEAGDEKKLFSANDDLRRLCCRCGTTYQLKLDGSIVSLQDCVFHWKRAFKKRINRTLESRYGCCDSDLSVKGCVIERCHVHQTMRKSDLSEFVRTPPPNGPNDPRSKRVYAMDCEMVYTTWGISLARVTVVDWTDEMVLDLLVKPKDKIVDCNTKFSGLTEEMILNAEHNLEKARKKLFELVNSETILIGHSLESDLRALRLVHRRVVDTSVVYPHRLGPPMKRALRNLASDYLQRIIQEDVGGHDSKEDSSTCLKLMLLKARSDLNS